MSALPPKADIQSKMCFLGLEALRARPAASGLRPPLEPNALGEQSMRTVALSLLTLGLPGIALADGGHPEASPFHLMAHFIYFGVPIALVVFGAVRMWTKNHRQ